MTVFTKRVAASGDDVMRIGRPRAWGNFSTADNTITIGDRTDGVESEIATRFTSVTVPQGATINSAKVTFRADSTLSTADCNMVIYAEDSDNAAAYTTDSEFDTGYGNRTTANVAWNAIESWTAGSDYDTPDITSVIQEVVDRGSWASGNAMQILFIYATSSEQHRREITSYDGASGTAPLLTIDYTEGAAFKAKAIMF